MSDRRFSRTHPLAPVLAALCLLTACGRGSDVVTPPPPDIHGPAASTASVAHPETDDESDHGEHAGKLTAARSAELGLHGTGQTTPLTDQQWSDPEAVAARFVLVDTTYSASEDPSVVNARRTAYASPRWAADVATASSGWARLEELRRRQARFVGKVEAVSTSEDNGVLAVIDLTAAVTLITNDAPPDRRVRFYQVILGLDAPTGRWLVARAQQS